MGCDHRWEIANAIARHDFPGMPSLAELDDDIQQGYLDFADWVIGSPMLRATEDHRLNPEPIRLRDRLARGVGYHCWQCWRLADKKPSGSTPNG